METENSWHVFALRLFSAPSQHATPKVPTFRPSYFRAFLDLGGLAVSESFEPLEPESFSLLSDLTSLGFLLFLSSLSCFSRFSSFLACLITVLVASKIKNLKEYCKE